MKYLIYWVNKTNGRNGRGKKRFTLEEANALCQELNSDYPDMDHTPTPVPDKKEANHGR